MPFLWDRIVVVHEHVVIIKGVGRVVKEWKEVEYVKDYGPEGKQWWSTYRWQLEAFIDKIKATTSTADNVVNGKKSDLWVEAEDSINQMKQLIKCMRRPG